MAFWCAGRTEPNREKLAVHCLGLAGYETYLPRLRGLRVSHGRKFETRQPLFPNYVFLRITLQWHTARWSPGMAGIIMNGFGPARLCDDVIAEIRGRERDGLIDLPTLSRLRSGQPVNILRGPFAGHLGIYAGMKPHDRVEVLLALLGGKQRITLAAQDVEAAR